MRGFPASLCGCVLALGPIGFASESTLTIRDNIGRPWLHEPIVWELPGIQGNSVLVQRDGLPIPAQTVSVEGATRVLFIVDRLSQDASTTVTADFSRQGPTTTDLGVTEEDGAWYWPTSSRR